MSCCLGKLQHLGVKESPRRSTLSYANAHRPWQLFEAVFGQLLAKCQPLARGRQRFRFRNRLYSFDSTVIELCVSLFDWAKYQKTKGAVKLHLLLDHQGYLPTYAVISEGNVHDVRMIRKLTLPADSIIVIDRGYVDYALFARWTDEGVWFVTRMKSDASYEVVEQRDVPRGGRVLEDAIVVMTGASSARKSPYFLRRLVVFDPQTGKSAVLLTNHLRFGATTIADLYRERWQIELFFKALKQNLRVKSFVGTTANAVRVQIWTALIAMLLLKYLQLRSKLGWALSNLVALLRWNLFTYRDLWRWIDQPYDTPPEPLLAQQLNLALEGVGQHGG